MAEYAHLLNFDVTETHAVWFAISIGEFRFGLGLAMRRYTKTT